MKENQLLAARHPLESLGRSVEEHGFIHPCSSRFSGTVISRHPRLLPGMWRDLVFCFRNVAHHERKSRPLHLTVR
jgi:hypothetical protein